MSLDLKRQLIAQLVESSRLLRNYIDQRAKGRGTTRAQWIVLFRLRQQEGLSQVDLAEVLELQPISLVRLLDRLVEHGLLERRHDPKDRRANRLFLTASGRQLVDDLDSLRDSIAIDVLQDIPSASLKTSLETLKDIKERIKGFTEPGDSPPNNRRASGTPRRPQNEASEEGASMESSQVIRRLPWPSGGRSSAARQPRYCNSRLPQKIWRGNNRDNENPAPMWIQLIQGRNVSDPR